MILLDRNTSDLTPGADRTAPQPVDGEANPIYGVRLLPRTTTTTAPAPTSALPTQQQVTAQNGTAGVTTSGMTSDAGAYQQSVNSNGETITYFGQAVPQTIGQEFSITPAPSSGTPVVTSGATEPTSTSTSSGTTTTPNTTGGGGSSNVSGSDTANALLAAIGSLFGNQDVQPTQLAPVQLAPLDDGSAAPIAATSPNYGRIVAALLVVLAIGGGWWLMRKRTH